MCLHFKYFGLIAFILLGTRAFGQEMPGKFESLLDSMDLLFVLPTEGKLKTEKLDSNIFFNHQIKLKDRRNEYEVFIMLEPEDSDDDIIRIPHFTFMRLTSNIATNDPDKDIMVVTWDDRKLKTRKADWGAESYVQIKESISSFPNAKIISFYKDEVGMVTILYCFDNPYELPGLLYFNEPDTMQ